ncbi:hypothetical protein [Acidianus manzaensis]|uniref:Uncharacterized protein n=1 Tax=Acidianus manzaensis TaxID=282676 RepID=A0A1W6K389_9CREN|nr:hypothetical protein [Acidianus manzaensis]ARM76970.1 hypothetical protein B6F84_13715 [Acidianus manzaensis]
MSEIISLINEKLGIPGNIVSAVSSVMSLPLLPTVATSLTFFSIFASLYVYWYKHKSIDSIKIEDLEEEENKVILDNEEKERKLNSLYERRKMLQEEVKKNEGIIKSKYEKELQNVENEIKILEGEYEENLDRIAFIKSLKQLIKHKKYLKEKGIWNKLDELNKKIEKSYKDIDMAVIKHEEIRKFLSSFNVEANLVNEK